MDPLENLVTMAVAQVEWVHPGAFWLLPLPLLMRLLPPYREQRDAVRVPFFARLLAASGSQPQRGALLLMPLRIQKFLVVLLWVALVIGAAKPQWLGPPIEQQKAGRDLMIAVDLSGSMETKDFTRPNLGAVDRLTAVKGVLAKLANERPGDRLGLIVFGSAAYLQSPFTEDHEAWLELLDETRIRMAGPSTALGDAVGLAIKLFQDATTEHRVMLVLTDGNDTGSLVPPVDAARVAAAADIRIYPIAVGDPSAVGEEAIDLDTLARMAEVTGGRSFQALDSQALDEVFSLLDKLEPNVFDSVSFRPRADLHWLPVAAVLLIYVLLRLIAVLTIPRDGRSAHA